MNNSVSVIMVSYHTGPVLMTALASVLMQDGLAELVLVDNGNPPDVVARLQQMALSDARIHVLSGHGNVGFAAACNLGAKVATGEYLLLLNPDCIVPPAALTTLVREMNVLPNTVLAGVHLLNADGSEQRGGRRPLLTPSSALQYVFSWKKLPPMPKETHDVPAISGACMCMRKTDYDAISGLDEGYFLHVEDLDLCLRVTRAGKRIVCVPAVRVAHLLSTSGKASSAFIERHKTLGFLRYFEKNFKESLPPGSWRLLKAGIWLRHYLRRLRSAKHARNVAASRKLMVLASTLTLPQIPGTLAGKTVLVMGATSQVGVYVLKHLLASGAAVLAVSRDEPLPFTHPALKWIRGDITLDGFSLGGYLADVAIHCAPQWHLPKILPLLAASDVRRVVAVGSTSVFTKASSHHRFEKELVQKHQRAEAEIAKFAGIHHIAWTILRPTMIYGMGIDHNVGMLARWIKKTGFALIYPHALGRRQPVHAEDVALATLQAATTETTFGRAYNIGGEEILTYRAMLERVFDVLRLPPRIIATTLLPLCFSIIGMLFQKTHITRDMAYRMNEDLVFFHDDAVHDFGYRPRAFLSGGTADLGE